MLDRLWAATLLCLYVFFAASIAVYIFGPDGPRTAREQARPRTAQEQAEQQAAEQQKKESERFLCHLASACQKYREARLDCATAGNLRTCLHIKMGDDALYSGMCSGNDEGAVAVPLPPETPNAVECFFITLPSSLPSLGLLHK
jgi:hypothetical protein